MAKEERKIIGAAKVIGGNLNLRNKPSFKSKVKKVFYEGEEVKIFGYTEDGEWAETEDGFLKAEFIKMIDDND